MNLEDMTYFIRWIVLFLSLIFNVLLIHHWDIYNFYIWDLVVFDTMLFEDTFLGFLTRRWAITINQFVFFFQGTRKSWWVCSIVVEKMTSPVNRYPSIDYKRSQQTHTWIFFKLKKANLVCSSSITFAEKNFSRIMDKLVTYYRDSAPWTKCCSLNFLHKTWA